LATTFPISSRAIRGPVVASQALQGSLPAHEVGEARDAQLLARSDGDLTTPRIG
jgi:hypothetical protein